MGFKQEFEPQFTNTTANPVESIKVKTDSLTKIIIVSIFT